MTTTMLVLINLKMRLPGQQLAPAAATQPRRVAGSTTARATFLAEIASGTVAPHLGLFDAAV
jgi:hypothetical protein